MAALLLITGCGGKTAEKVSQSGPDSPLKAPALPVDTAAAQSRVNLSHAIAAGSRVHIALTSVVDSAKPKDLGFVNGRVLNDVKGADGRVAIPADCPAILFAKRLDKKGRIAEVDISLFSVNIFGRQYNLSTGPDRGSTLVFTDDRRLGPTHASVHLYYGQELMFKLDHAIQFPQL
jgi:hypothetical protein